MDKKNLIIKLFKSLRGEKETKHILLNNKTIIIEGLDLTVIIIKFRQY